MSLDFVDTALNRKILKHSIFHALRPHGGIVISLRLTQVFFDLATRIPRHLYHPVDITTHYSRFCRHRNIIFSFCNSASAFSFASFRHLRRVDFCASGLRFSSGASSISEFFLNSFHLLVQIVLAGISPSAFTSYGCECVSQPAADRFPIPSLPSDIPDVR